MPHTASATPTLRILQPHPHVLAFYDGRVPGVRSYSAEPNWLDDGGFSLGIASYAIVDGADALVYDTHLSVPHARAVRASLEALGVRNMRVVLSHWHLDHIAGNAVFADCEMLAHAWTRDAMLLHRAAIEAGTYAGPPAIAPLVLPTVTYEGTHVLQLGRFAVELRHVDIHSRDGTMLLLPGERLLLAGDALEDSVTYVSEPEGLDNHLRDLARMATWEIDHILPNHGDPGRIAAARYDKGLITATERYTRRLASFRDGFGTQETALRDWIADDIAAGHISYFAPYEQVHLSNLASVRPSGA
jgi:cyclase